MSDPKTLLKNEDKGEAAQGDVEAFQYGKRKHVLARDK